MTSRVRQPRHVADPLLRRGSFGSDPRTPEVPFRERVITLHPRELPCSYSWYSDQWRRTFKSASENVHASQTPPFEECFFFFKRRGTVAIPAPAEGSSLVGDLRVRRGDGCSDWRAAALFCFRRWNVICGAFSRQRGPYYARSL